MTRFIATLISPAPLPPGLIDAVAVRLGGQRHGSADGALSCDLAFEAEAPDLPAELARGLIEDLPIDLVIQPEATRARRLLLADMDSTIVQEETLDELAASVGLKEKIAAITARAMNGELDFVAAVTERVAMLEGLPVTALEETLARVRLMPGAEGLIAGARAACLRCVLVSGGFTFFTDAIAARLGFDRAVGNVLEIAEGRLTGRIVPPIRDKQTKLDVLREEAAALGIGLEAAVTIGDGANDLPMLQAAGLGIAFHARPSVRAVAPARLDYCDLSAVLRVLGLPNPQSGSPASAP